ncbi:MAG: cyclic nucleotide-binding domain-containing protein [Endomicrobiales bacterium]|nr:cyclic nucleotide-binding domain-containing protein [Endomicrobiales bacterium]
MNLLDIFSKVFMDKEFKENVNFFSTIALFKGLSIKSLGKLVSVAHKKTYFSGETVFEQGQVGRVLYIVKSGGVSVTKNAQKISSYSVGESFGEVAMLEELPRTATIVCDTDTELYLIYKVKYDSFIEQYPKAGLTLFKNLALSISAKLRNCLDKLDKSFKKD